MYQKNKYTKEDFKSCGDCPYCGSPFISIGFFIICSNNECSSNNLDELDLLIKSFKYE